MGLASLDIEMGIEMGGLVIIFTMTSREIQPPLMRYVFIHLALKHPEREEVCYIGNRLCVVDS
jgi:hypothetical protein